MMASLELKKSKRTGLIPVFLIGGLFSAAIPLLNMAFRSEVYVNLPDSPLQILLQANWQMMAMMNLLLIAAGACLLYFTEYADNAIQKMKSLPVKESTLYFGKVILLTSLYAVLLVLEAVALIVSTSQWFGLNDGFWIELGKNFGFFFLLGLPSILLALMIASLFQNIWVSLGLNVVAVFLATMLSSQSFVLSLFPFALPLQTLGGVEVNQLSLYIGVALIEVAVIAVAEWIFLRIRRSFE